MNVKMERITVTSTPSVTTLLDHLPVLVHQATREMACNAQVREGYVIILSKIACILMIVLQHTKKPQLVSFATQKRSLTFFYLLM